MGDRSNKGGKRGSKTRRVEPRLFQDDRVELRSEKRKTRPKRRSWILRLLRFFAISGFWVGLAGALAFAFIWFSLDQRGLLQIPKREPGIMILANDGTLLAQEGSFFGDAAK